MPGGSVVVASPGVVATVESLDVEGCAPLVDEIASSMQRNAGAMLGLVRLKTHDDYTFMHSVAVCTLMVVLSRRMGLDEAQVREAGLAGLLHDMGKAKIPLEVLNKEGKRWDILVMGILREEWMEQNGYKTTN